MGKEGDLIPIERFTQKYNERSDREFEKFQTAKKLGIERTFPKPEGKLIVGFFRGAINRNK